MSVENTKANVTAQDNAELSKVLNELSENIKNNPFIQMFAQALSVLNNEDIFKKLPVDEANGSDGRYPIEYSYNEKFIGSEDKFTKIITDKLDYYTFKALLTNGRVKCNITFTFTDTAIVFDWDNDLKHFVGVVKEDEIISENMIVYNEIKGKFVSKNEYLKSLNNDDTIVEEDECDDEDEIFTDVEVVEDKEDAEDKVEEVYEEKCTPIKDISCPEKCDTTFADQLYEKLNKQFKEDNFEKYKGDLIVAFHRIFDYEMYEPGFNDDHSEIDTVNFTLEDVLMVCPSANVGKFWEKISSQKIVGLIADEFKFRSVTTYLDQEDGTHRVVCNLK